MDQCNSRGLAPLHLATLQRCTATVRALIRGGAALDTATRCGGAPASPWLCRGSTALHLACALGSSDIAAALLEAAAANPGADALARSKSEI